MAVRELKEHGLESILSKSTGNDTTIYLYTQDVELFGQRVTSDDVRNWQSEDGRF